MKGYYIPVRSKGYFIETAQKRKSKELTHRIIKLIAEDRGLDPEWTERILKDPESCKKIQTEMTASELKQHCSTTGEHWITISTNGMTANFPQEALINNTIVIEYAE
jgi:hypothetical protein